jgi:hypothetical protein
MHSEAIPGGVGIGDPFQQRARTRPKGLGARLFGNYWACSDPSWSTRFMQCGSCVESNIPWSYLGIISRKMVYS